MRYLIDARLEEGDPSLTITDAESGTVRLHWTYRRAPVLPGQAHECSDGPPCAGCSALHCLLNHLFLLACADKLAAGEPVAAVTPESSRRRGDTAGVRRRGATPPCGSP